MNSAIEELIRSGESDRVEFKSNLEDEAAIAKTVCGLLNANGGVVIVGVDQDGKFTDEVHAADAEKLEHFLRQKIAPSAVFSVALEELAEHKVVSVEIPSGSEKPYVADRQIYVRVGRKTLMANPVQSGQLLEGRSGIGERWERRIALDLSIDNLDQALITQTVDFARRRGYSFQDPNDPQSCLEELGLMRRGQLTNAADVLFGVGVGKRHPQTRVRALRFESDRSGNHVDEQLLEGPAPKLLEDLFNFARRNIEVSGEFSSNQIERIVHPRIPFPAIREGLVNALVHRDYSAFSGGLALRIFPSRVEIWNSGSFPEGYRKRDLRRAEHPSVLNNPDISMVFYLLGLMERTGRGAFTIIQECLRAGLKEPEWRDAKGVGVLLKMEAKSDSPGLDLSLEHDRILSLAKEKGGRIRVADVDLPERSARRRLMELVGAGHLLREGEGRATVYVLNLNTESP